MLDEGKSIRQIAHALRMSTFTVQKLKKQIADNEKLPATKAASRPTEATCRFCVFIKAKKVYHQYSRN